MKGKGKGFHRWCTKIKPTRNWRSIRHHNRGVSSTATSDMIVTISEIVNQVHFFVTLIGSFRYGKPTGYFRKCPGDVKYHMSITVYSYTRHAKIQCSALTHGDRTTTSYAKVAWHDHVGSRAGSDGWSFGRGWRWGKCWTKSNSWGLRLGCSFSK